MLMTLDIKDHFLMTSCYQPCLGGMNTLLREVMLSWKCHLVHVSSEIKEFASYIQSGQTGSVTYLNCLLIMSDY